MESVVEMSIIIKFLDSNTIAMAAAFFKQQYNYVTFTTYLIFPQNWMDWSKKIATALIKVSWRWNPFCNKIPFKRLTTKVQSIKLIKTANQSSLWNGIIKSCHLGFGGGFLTKKQI